MKNISVLTISGSTQITINNYPDTCPHCHYSGNFNHCFAAVDPNYSAFLSFYCNRNECNHYFVFEYVQGDAGWFYLDRPINGTLKGIKYSVTISNISSSFVDIYSQSERAENIALKDICGVGYRKALEFLIKDYIILGNPLVKLDVENKPLAVCIGDYISNPTIKDIAKRAVWLGNDETHYVRKWEGMDITHLKQLIALTVHWIETEELTKEIIAAMPDPKK